MFVIFGVNRPPVCESQLSGTMARHSRIMGDQDQGGAVLRIKVKQQINDLYSRFLIQVAGQFIGKQHQRRAGKGPGYGDPLLFAAG